MIFVLNIITYSLEEMFNIITQICCTCYNRNYKYGGYLYRIKIIRQEKGTKIMLQILKLIGSSYLIF